MTAGEETERASRLLAAGERLIVALDVPGEAEAYRLVDQLGEAVSFYKVGFELFVAAGPAMVRGLIKRGKRVFLDLKFFDVGETVQRAARAAARLGATFLTVHGHASAQQAAVRGAAGSGLQILIVTLLTSLDHDDVKELFGPAATPAAIIRQRVEKAMANGIHGVIASGQEVAEIRALAGDRLLIVTPGIRPSGAGADDHKRASTPFESIRGGADYLVVGRPIRDAADPRAAAQAIVAEIEEGLKARA
ncbi:MAG: orotidine-5'-phosphate decarboxylase [Candidatus Tectomicrobia bacterium]|nr:orotidine-5'-phosphate decarboxylase [Candidatus Tectomicrobia bacterium]